MIKTIKKVQKKTTLIVSLIAVLGIVGTTTYTVIKSKAKIYKKLWKQVQVENGFITPTGHIIKVNTSDDVGGIRILPVKYKGKVPTEKELSDSQKNYVPNTMSINLTIYAPPKFSPEQVILFESIPVDSAVKLLPHEKEPILWVVQEPSQTCSFDNPKVDYVQSHPQICETKLYKFDLTSKQLSPPIWTLPFSKDRSVIPLVHDSKHQQLWLVSQHNLSRVEQEYDEKTGRFTTVKNGEYYNTTFYLFNEKTGEVKSFYENFGRVPIYWHFNESQFITGVTGKYRIADVDSNGNLFVLMSCETDGCEELTDISKVEILKVDLALQQKNTPEYEYMSLITIPTFSTNTSLFGSQITMDKTSNLLYLVNGSWKDNTPSHFFKYDISLQRFSDIGGMPTNDRDDTRGFTVVDGKLLVGFFEGLGIYNPKEDNWKFIRETQGLKENGVETIVEITNDKLCLNHNSKDISCLKIPFNIYAKFASKKLY